MHAHGYYYNTKLFDDLYYSFIDLGGKLGYQGNFNYRNSFYYDFYFGFASRKASMLTLQETTTNGGYYGASTQTYSEYLQSFNLIQVMLGTKIGFAF